jgi:hypothetical protein
VGPAHGTLQNAYKKFKAYHEASAKLEALLKAGSWQGPKPTQGAIKDLFSSRSFFSSHFTKFNKISDYPELQKWLDDHPEKKSDQEVWGLKKEKYTFADIDTFVAQKGTLVVLVEESEEEVVKGRKKKDGKGKKSVEGEKAGEKSEGKRTGKKGSEGEKATGSKKGKAKKVEVEKKARKGSSSSKKFKAK